MSLQDSSRAALSDRAARKAAGKSNFNADKTRYIAREFLGWVCYQGQVRDGDFIGHRCGVCAEESTADRWLAGERVYFEQKADAHGTLRVGGGWSEADAAWQADLLAEDEARVESVVNPPGITPYDFCDGNHAAPRCLDPRCWRDDEEDAPEAVDTAPPARSEPDDG